MLNFLKHLSKFIYLHCKNITPNPNIYQNGKSNQKLASPQKFNVDFIIFK